MNLGIGLKNSKNIVYTCCIANPWLDIVDKLNNELGLNPKYFIGWDDGSIKIKEKYKDCFFQVIEDAWDGKAFPALDYSYPIDEELLKSISFEQNIALKMMDRLDLDRYSFNFSDRQSFFYFLLKKWLVVLEKYEIDIIISPSIPHRVFDYILYIAAKLKNIEFIMFQMTPFEDSSFIINDIEQTPEYLKQDMIKNNVNHNLREDIEIRIKQVTGDYACAIPDYMKEQSQMLKKNGFINKLAKKIGTLFFKPNILFEKNTTYHVSQDSMPYEDKEPKYRFILKKYKNKVYLNKLQELYESLITDKYNKKYIFVALHYQPEETSTPTGGVFTDQELIINLLDYFLDKNIDIVVKEHKTQFHPNYEGATGRSSSFYNNILKNSNRVKFVSVESDPFILIDNAIATVTISGTIGWESVIRGTPSLVFGRAWYEDMVGVYKIKTLEDLAFNWSSIINDKNNIAKEDIYDFHRKLQKFLIDAPHYKAFVGKINRRNDENIENIFNGIKNHLKKINYK